MKSQLHPKVALKLHDTSSHLYIASLSFYGPHNQSVTAFVSHIVTLQTQLPSQVLKFISCGKSTPVDRDKVVMEMNPKSLPLNVPSPVDTVHLCPSECIQIDCLGLESCSRTGGF